MKNFWYIISEQDLTQEMLEAAYGGKIILTDLCAYQCNLRKITDGIKKYYLLPFPYNFATPMQGLDFYTTEELKTELKKAKWLHNNEEAI